MPRSRATWAIVSSGSEWYKATASTLNSGEYTFMTISGPSSPAPTGAGIRGVHHSGGSSDARVRMGASWRSGSRTALRTQGQLPASELHVPQSCIDGPHDGACAELTIMGA